MSNHDHTRLVIAGPVEVRKSILDAQTEWMVGHRSQAFADLYASLQPKLQQVFLTENRVYSIASSGTGFWEAASRNCIRDGKKALHFTSGAFSERWVKVSQSNGKEVDVVSADWGRAITPEMVAEALEKDTYDAVCVVHNETSTSVTNPIKEIGEVVAQYDDTFFLVDTVSGVSGTELRVDDWGVDIALCSSQKAFALPPGLAFMSVSDRVLERAATIENRGYYFDLLGLEKYHRRNNTPSTPPVSIMYAADKQLSDILEEGLEARWQRHIALKERTHEWALANGFGLYAEEGYRSNTITAIENLREIDVFAMADFMREEKGFAMDKGYGNIKGKTFRIGHIGDMTLDYLNEVLSGLDDFLAQA